MRSCDGATDCLRDLEIAKAAERSIIEEKKVILE
jgi:hypothetical protein